MILLLEGLRPASVSPDVVTRRITSKSVYEKDQESVSPSPRGRGSGGGRTHRAILGSMVDRQRIDRRVFLPAFVRRPPSLTLPHEGGRGSRKETSNVRTLFVHALRNWNGLVESLTLLQGPSLRAKRSNLRILRDRHAASPLAMTTERYL